MSEAIGLHRKASDHGLAAAIGRGTIFGVISNGAQIATRLITVPIVIHHLGLGGYGIWSIIMVTASYMRFGVAGIKSAFQKYVAEATANGDFANANRLLSTGGISMLVLSLAGLIPIAIFSKYLAVSAGVPDHFVKEAANSISVLALTYVVTNFGATFEAIVTGGHRVDLTRKINIVLTVCEAVAIVLLLHFGYGLLAMTTVMGLSELIFILCCYKLSRQVVPQMQVSIMHFSKHVFPELIRFAGSYQLVNVLEVLYGAILPIVILRIFGAPSAGLYAVITRAVTSALIAQEALILPILSGGTFVFSSGSAERIGRFLNKSFKVTILSLLPPLGFLGTFGTVIILAWTGQADPSLWLAIWLCSIAALLKGTSLLQLILYRASGRALLDNIRQVLRILLIVAVALASRRLGFTGVLAGMACAELIAVAFMFFAMEQAFASLDVELLARDILRISAATALIIGAGILAGSFPHTWGMGVRIDAAIKLGQIAAGCLIIAWPAFILTKSLSIAERQMLFDILLLRRRTIPAAAATEIG